MTELSEARKTQLGPIEDSFGGSMRLRLRTSLLSEVKKSIPFQRLGNICVRLAAACEVMAMPVDVDQGLGIYFCSHSLPGDSERAQCYRREVEGKVRGRSEVERISVGCLSGHQFLVEASRLPVYQPEKLTCSSFFTHTGMPECSAASEMLRG